MNDRGGNPCPPIPRGRSFAGIFFRRRRLLVLLVAMIAMDAVLSRTNRDEAIDQAQVVRPSGDDMLMCRVVRMRGRPLQLENRVDWCPRR